MKLKRGAAIAAGAIFLFVLTPCARGQGSQSGAPPAAASAAGQQKDQTSLLPGLVHVNASELHRVHWVAPVYPPTAAVAGIQGTVLFRAVIGKDGAIKELRWLSGPPILMPAALDALKQWRYEPYIVNGEAVEVDTSLWANFGSLPPTAEEAVSENHGLADKLQRLLPSNVQVADAAHGYKDVHDFEVALLAARDLGIPFTQLKCAELGGVFCDPQSNSHEVNLEKAIQALKPEMSKDDVKNAEKKAKAEVKAIS